MLLKQDYIAMFYLLICPSIIGFQILMCEHLNRTFKIWVSACFISEEKKFLRKWLNNSKLSHSLGLIGVDDAEPLLQNHSGSLIL